MILVLEVWYRMNIENNIIDKPDFSLDQLIGYNKTTETVKYEASIAKS